MMRGTRILTTCSGRTDNTSYIWNLTYHNNDTSKTQNIERRGVPESLASVQVRDVTLEHLEFMSYLHLPADITLTVETNA